MTTAAPETNVTRVDAVTVATAAWTRPPRRAVMLPPRVTGYHQ